MDRELINKKIDNYFEIRKSLWTAIIVLTGGITGLLLSISVFSITIPNIIKLSVIFLGGVLDYLLIMGIASLNSDIVKYFTLIEKESKKWI